MASAIGSITRAATRKPGERLNVLTYSCHERYQTGLKNVNAEFYMVQVEGIKDWKKHYAPLPCNHHLLDGSKGNAQIPPYLDFDVILSQNKFGHIQYSHAFAKQLRLPIVSIEHTAPVPQWGKDYLAYLKTLRGDINVFISEYSRKAWGWEDDEAFIIHHCVDSETFSPNEFLVPKEDKVLSVVNDWINRDWCTGYSLWREVVKDLPWTAVGDTPGLSKPAASVAELVNHYRKASVFLNTSLVSPIPTVVLEAMSCGLPVVSTCNCMIPEIIEHGKNGLLSNDPGELNDYVKILLSNQAYAKILGENARKTILERFTLEKFTQNWDNVLRAAAELNS